MHVGVVSPMIFEVEVEFHKDFVKVEGDKNNGWLAIEPCWRESQQ